MIPVEAVEAWRCPYCGSNRSVGYGMWPGSGPVKAQCVPCGRVSDWPKLSDPDAR